MSGPIPTKKTAAHSHKKAAGTAEGTRRSSGHQGTASTRRDSVTGQENRPGSGKLAAGVPAHAGGAQKKPLAPKDANVPAAQKQQEKTAASATSHAHALPQHLLHRYVTIKATRKNSLLVHKIKDMVRNDQKRDAAFKTFISRKPANRLQTSFMPGGPSEGDDDDEKIDDVPAAHPDFMNMLNLSAFGNFGRMYTEVTFGENPESGRVELAIDTGSAVTWVNELAYKEALNKTKAKYGKVFKKKRFAMTYAAGTITGQLAKDKIKLCGITSQEVSLDFVFGLVDESKSPDAARWRRELDVHGIFALGDRQLAKDAVQEIGKDGSVKGREDLPTVMDRLLAKKFISKIIIGIHYQLPNEGKRQPDDSDSQSSGSSAGIMNADFHLGGINQSVFKQETLKMIPVTKVGDSATFGGLDLELKYEGQVVMAESHGIIDSGAEMIGLPGAILDAWLAAVNTSAGKEIVKYDQAAHTYHVKKEDFGLVKPLEFNFKKGSNATLSFEPRQQIYPPSLVRKQAAEDTKGDHYYFIFRRLSDTDGESRKFSLGELWMMWYYLVLDGSDPSNKQIGIADISGHTSHKWRGL